MSPADAIAYARKVKASWPPEKLNNAPKVARALIALVDLFDRSPEGRAKNWRAGPR